MIKCILKNIKTKSFFSRAINSIWHAFKTQNIYGHMSLYGCVCVSLFVYAAQITFYEGVFIYSYRLQQSLKQKIASMNAYEICH